MPNETQILSTDAMALITAVATAFETGVGTASLAPIPAGNVLGKALTITPSISLTWK